jgi:hypothetical protein
MEGIIGKVLMDGHWYGYQNYVYISFDSKILLLKISTTNTYSRNKCSSMEYVNVNYNILTIIW